MSAAAADLPAVSTRRERRRERKKQRRRRARREAAAVARAAAEALAADPEEERRLRELEEAEADASELARRAFEDAERCWLEAAASRAAEKAAAAAAEEEARATEAAARDKYKDEHRDVSEDEEWDYVEDGPAEIIWQGNEITVKKKMVKVPKKAKDKPPSQEVKLLFVIKFSWLFTVAEYPYFKLPSEKGMFNVLQEERPTSNPLPPQSVAVASQSREPSLSARELLEKVAQETPNFGTEQDKAHCPFYLKTAACRFGVRCSRVHFYPDKACTLLMKNMYNGPGLALEQDEGLEFTDEEIEQSYEEFYEDVHTEFLKFGELVNFKISCEFVAVTKWKAAICGEYMRSRFKTCSRGVACNFIHCFRNPGGDYEWADWENPPPKYWTRKMAALFGPSDDTVFDKASATLDFEWSRSSDRRRLRSSDDRYVSSRYRDGDAHKRHSSRDYSHSKHEQSSLKHGHSRHRREPSAEHKQQGQEIEDSTGRYSSAMENERVSKKHIGKERRNDNGDGQRDDDEIKSRKHRSERHESVEPGCSDWHSEFTDAGASKSPPGSKSTDRYNNHKRSRRQSYDDPYLEGRYSTAHKSPGKGHSTKRSSRRSTGDDSYDEKDGERHKYRKHSDHFDDPAPDDRWLATNSDVDSDAKPQSPRSSRRVGKLGSEDNARLDEDDHYQRSRSRRTKWRMEDDKSSRKRKHHSKIKKGSDSDEDPSDSKDTWDLGSHACSSQSRSSEEDVSLHRSRKRSRSSRDS
ncbi:hypothetical protein ACQ4PT_037160 [Festuca glaucescens]